MRALFAPCDASLSLPPACTTYMRDEDKTRDQLVEELVQIRRQLAASDVAMLERNLAVERVRTEALAMHRSDDLLLVVGVMFRELLALGVEAIGCLIYFLDDDPGRVVRYFAGESPTKYGISWTSSDIVAFDENIVVAAWDRHLNNRQQDLIERWHQGVCWADKPTREQVDKQLELLKREFGLSDYLPYNADQLVGTYIPFTKGIFRVRGPDLSPEHIRVVEAFTGVMSLGYLRYLDIRSAEEAQRKLIDEMDEELRTASQLQMSLMPTTAPTIPGLDVAGCCRPAGHVGGDLFQYFSLPTDSAPEQLYICLADVTGHAMQAAIPVVMFNGILTSQMETSQEPEELAARLNRTLHRTLDARTFVCCSIARIDLHPPRLALTNGGCPYPYYYRAADRAIREIELTAYPLGARSDTKYSVEKLSAEVGDYLCFCSDGIVETANSAGDIFGYERIRDLIENACRQGRTAHQIVGLVMETVRAFAADVPQEDDMTCVVVAFNH